MVKIKILIIYMFLNIMIFKIKKIYGQSYINKIVNKEIFDYQITNVENDAKTIGYPTEDDLHKTYSYIFVLSK